MADDGTIPFTCRLWQAAAVYDVIVTSARLEWMFWDSAYRLETRPP